MRCGRQNNSSYSVKYFRHPFGLLSLTQNHHSHRMADQSAELVRAGRCACTVEESRLTGREIAGLCNGERYIPYSTMYEHYKALKKRMAKKGKHDITRPKLEMVPRHVVCFTHDPCNGRQGVPQAQTLEASNEDIFCDDNGD